MAAFAAASNLITTTIGTYFTLFLSLPFTIWAYGALEPILGRGKGQSVTATESDDLSEVARSSGAAEKFSIAHVFAIWIGVGIIALAANHIAFKTVPDGATLAGLGIILSCVAVGFAVNELTRGMVPAVLWVSLVAMTLTYPAMPYAADIAALTGRINFLALATPVIALAGLSLAKDLPVFGKLGWRIVVVMRLLAAAKAATSLAISGVCWAEIAPAAAAIRLPDPIPAPMARACGWKMPRLVTMEEEATKTAPKTVPVMYSASTPCPSGLDMP